MTMSVRPWICLLDEREGRLLRGRPVPADRVRLDVHATIANSWEEHEHGRPSPRTGKNGNAYASWGHEGETMRARFADDVAQWLDEQARSLEIDRVTVIAPARFLGALRKAWPRTLRDRVDTREGDLRVMGHADLIRHPVITELLEAVPRT